MFLLSLFCIVDIKDINNVATITGVGEITKDLFSKVSASEIKQIIIEFGPNKVSDDAFTSCTSLQILNVSLSIPYISSTALNCYSTIAINVPKEHLTLSSDEQGALYNKNQTIIYHVPRKLSEFTIPETVETIPKYCFKRCNFKTLNIPSKVSLISDYAFNEITISKALTFSHGVNLTIAVGAFAYSIMPTVHIPSNCLSIGKNSFIKSQTSNFIFDDYNNSKLSSLGSACFTGFLGTSITLPQTITGIPEKCFESSKSLEEVFIPRSCATIDMSAFDGCAKLKKITIDPSNTNFADIDGLIFDKQVKQLYFIPPNMETITLPSTLEDIGSTVLQSSPVLTTINTEDNERFSFEGGVLYDKEKENVIGACGGITEPSIIDNAVAIRNSAFSSSSFTNITFGVNSKMSTIGEKAFENCLNLKIVSLPKQLTSIGIEAFSGCKQLKEVLFDTDCPLSQLSTNCFWGATITQITIPKNVQRIQYRTFFNCKSLANVFLSPNSSLYYISSQTFYGCSNLISISNVGSIKSIETQAFYECTKLEFNFKEAKNLSSIGSSAFYTCSTTEITFFSLIKSLGERAFESNTKLQNVEFSDDCQLTSLPSSLFIKCTSLQKVKLSPKIADLEYYVFSGCSSLVEIDCSSSDYLANYGGLVYQKEFQNLILCPPGREYGKVSGKATDIKENAFRGCSKLVQIDFDQPSKLKNVKSYTFNGCSKLTKVTLPNTVSSLGENSFSDCVSLKHLPIETSSNILEIPSYCFSNTGIEILNIPSWIKEIRSESFSNCKQLKTITILGSIETIESSVFDQCDNIRTVKFCGNKDICNGADIFNNIEVIVDVSIFYKSDSFGKNIVRRSLDPKCSFITAAGRTESSLLFFAIQLENSDDEQTNQ